MPVPKILLFGRVGQVGWELRRTLAPLGQLVVVDYPEVDFTRPESVRTWIRDTSPDIVVNAAAYTAVDKAESQSEIAWAVNRDGAVNLARAAREAGARFAHVSTDFVFDGRAGRAYLPDDPTGPLGVYGASKLAGEIGVAEAAPGSLILRTAWVYSPHGGNFLKTMLRLMAERGEVRVVADQIGTPTSATTLAQTLWALTAAGASGIHHHTDAGVASWYDFAQAIGEDAHALGLLASPPRILPIATSDYPTPAARPAFSVLDKSSTWAILGGPVEHWRPTMRTVLGRMAAVA